MLQFDFRMNSRNISGAVCNRFLLSHDANIHGGMAAWLLTEVTDTVGRKKGSHMSSSWTIVWVSIILITSRLHNNDVVGLLGYQIFGNFKLYTESCQNILDKTRKLGEMSSFTLSYNVLCHSVCESVCTHKMSRSYQINNCTFVLSFFASLVVQSYTFFVNRLFDLLFQHPKTQPNIPSIALYLIVDLIGVNWMNRCLLG